MRRRGGELALCFRKSLVPDCDTGTTPITDELCPAISDYAFWTNSLILSPKPRGNSDIVLNPEIAVQLKPALKDSSARSLGPRKGPALATVMTCLPRVVRAHLQQVPSPRENCSNSCFT